MKLTEEEINKSIAHELARGMGLNKRLMEIAVKGIKANHRKENENK